MWVFGCKISVGDGNDKKMYHDLKPHLVNAKISIWSMPFWVDISGWMLIFNMISPIDYQDNMYGFTL